MKRTEIIIAGFGGQGVILAGFILGRAALYDGKYATQIQSYGPEARGGACRSEVIIADEPIDYPGVVEADILLTMSQESFNKYINTLKSGGVLFFDADLVKVDKTLIRGKAYEIPATRIASETFKRRIVANMIMLGALSSLTKVVTKESLEKTVKESVLGGTEGINLEAIKMGFKIFPRVKN